MIDLSFMAECFGLLVAGVPLTLRLAVSAVSLGLGLAAALAVLQVCGIGPLGLLARAYVFAFRGTPLLLQIFLIYYGMGQFRPLLQEWGLWGFFRDPYWCGLTALTLNTGAYAAELIRGSLLAVPAGQVEAARACGMSRGLVLRRVVLPIALRQVLPGYGNEIVLMVKATSLVSTITLMEVTGIAHRLIAETFRAVEVFVCAGAIYLALNFLATRLVQAAEWWLSPHLRAPNR